MDRVAGAILARPEDRPDAVLRALPDPAPLDMPVQALAARVPRSGPIETAPPGLAGRRAYVMGTTIALTAFGAKEMYDVLSVGSLTPLETMVLALFVALFAWIAFSFASSLAGFFHMLGGKPALGIDPRAPLPVPGARTALLMPTYNEAPSRVMAGLQAIYEDLEAAGRIGHFDIFILSDTTDPDIWVAEEAAFLALRRRTGGQDRIFYRRRAKNLERKAGNIADWVQRFGGSYPHMLVLDADSVMSADTIVRLAAAMEAHPRVGLIQTLPVIVNGRTLFARLQQFAGRVYGPLIAHGIAWWHGSEGNYWGHNAIIRTCAFAEQAGLPHIRGGPPFGGHILSHDFVEAALIRRGGWAVHMVPQLAGSYEESPPSLSDVAIRDRRWCQGNLQHAAILPARGLHWVSRLHLLTGIGSYVTAPMWIVFLGFGMLIALQARFIRPEYFTAEFSLFPQWPAQDPVRAAWVFAGTMAVLLLPKLLACLALLLHPADRRASGGGIRVFIGLLIETLIAGLLAPLMMLFQSLAVVQILIGRDAGWRPQRREDGSVPFGQTARQYMPHTLFGLAMAAASYAVSLPLFLWMSPVIIGLVLAIPLAAITGQRRAGTALRRLGLLAIPEETHPPPVLARVNELTAELGKDDTGRDAVGRLADDPELYAAHRAMLGPAGRRGIRAVEADLAVGLAKLEEADSRAEAVEHLSPREKAAVLADRRALERLFLLPA